MVILWLSNVPTSKISQIMGLTKTTSGGWLEQTSVMLATDPSVELHFCFMSGTKESHEGTIGKIRYHALSKSNTKLIGDLKDVLISLLRRVQPDIVHIFGSEFSHSYAMALACQEMGLLDRTILHIQGLVSVYAMHYDLGIPGFWKHLMMPRDFIKNASIARSKKDFAKRGEYEIETIKMLRHVSGRTDWDKACAYHINPEAQYHFCNETLRESFYKHRWDISRCERNSIFVSQGSYPIKGLHFLLEALPLILKHFPDTCVYVGGADPTKAKGSFLTRLKRTSYGQYILHLINKYKLSEHVIFTGPLDEEQMCDRFLKSHVFVSPSTIENSPNSLGEAMILGMPCVSSYVGGVANMLKDKEEGFLYQADAPYMLAYYVCMIFSDDGLAMRLSQKSRQRGNQTHNVDINLRNLLEIYDSLLSVSA